MKVNFKLPTILIFKVHILKRWKAFNRLYKYNTHKTNFALKLYENTNPSLTIVNDIIMENNSLSDQMCWC